MKYYLIKLLTNTQGQDGSSIAVFDTLDKAKISYHQTIATYINAEDVLHAVVKILDYNGNVVMSDFVDHTPEPEPEPEPEEE